MPDVPKVVPKKLRKAAKWANTGGIGSISKPPPDVTAKKASPTSRMNKSKSMAMNRAEDKTVMPPKTMKAKKKGDAALNKPLEPIVGDINQGGGHSSARFAPQPTK